MFQFKGSFTYYVRNYDDLDEERFVNKKLTSETVILPSWELSSEGGGVELLELGFVLSSCWSDDMVAEREKYYITE